MKLSRPIATSSDSSTVDREIFATRVFDAPRELVFQMFSAMPLQSQVVLLYENLSIMHDL